MDEIFEIKTDNLGFMTNMPDFKSIGDAMRHGINVAEYYKSKGVLMYAFSGGPMHPLSGNASRLEKYDIKAFATNGCEVTSTSESWQKCFNIVMNYSKIPKLDTILEILIGDIIYKDKEFSKEYDDLYYTQFKKGVSPSSINFIYI